MPCIQKSVSLSTTQRIDFRLTSDVDRFLAHLREINWNVDNFLKFCCAAKGELTASISIDRCSRKLFKECVEFNKTGWAIENYYIHFLIDLKSGDPMGCLPWDFGFRSDKDKKKFWPIYPNDLVHLV